MKVETNEIKYFNQIDRLVDVNTLIKYINYLLSIKSKKYLCYLHIDDSQKIGKKLLIKLRSKIEKELVTSKLFDVVSKDEEWGYVIIGKDNFDGIYFYLKAFHQLLGLKEKITFSCAIVSFDLGISYGNLMDIAYPDIDRAILQGGNCILVAKESEPYNKNLVEPHLICKYCGKITNIYQFENRVLTPDKILKDSNYKTIKIHRCNRCDVASLDLRNPKRFNHSVLESSDYLNILRKNIPDNEKNILLAVIIYLSVNDYLSAGMLMYFYYELTKKENAKKYVLEYLDSSEAIEAHILLLDFLRKTNEEEVFRGTIKYHHPQSRYHRMLINLEEYKMNLKDYGDLNYIDDISYKHFFKDDKNEHENLTGLELFSGDNIEGIHSLYEIPEEYILSAAVKYNQEYYCIYIIPYIGLARVYKVDILNDYKIELVEDRKIYSSIIDEYNNIKNNTNTNTVIKAKNEPKKMYFEEAMIAFANQDKEKCKEYLNKGIENNEVYAYYYADQFLMPIDYERFEELKKEDNPYALAVRGKEILHDDEKLGIALLESSDCGVAKYNLYTHYYENDEEKKAQTYLEQAIGYDFPLAYKDFAREIKLDGDYIPIAINGMNHLDICDKAISYGFVDGYYAKAHLYEEGHAVEKDLNKAIEIYKLLPDSEYSYRNIDLIRNYYNLGEYEEVYDLCMDYVSKKELFEEIAIKRLGDIYSQESFSKYDLIKSLIYKKSLITSNQCENEVIEIAYIYYEHFKNFYMAQQYVNFFKELVDYNDTCMVHYENYIEMIYDVDEYEEDNPDKTDYYSIGRKALKNKNYKESYEAFLSGFMLDDNKCFIELIKFYLEGIIVEKDIAIAQALNKAANNELLFKKKIEKDEMEEFLEDFDSFSLRLHMQNADDSYFMALDASNTSDKLELLKEALEDYQIAYEKGADYVLDRINEIKEMIKSMK